MDLETKENADPFVIWDSRYISDPYSASVFATADSMEEARDLADLYGACVITGPDGELETVGM